MWNVLRQFAVLFCLGAASAAFAQTSAKSPAKPDTKPEAKTDAKSAQTLDAIIALEDPNARIAALQQLLKANPNNDKTVPAREALVASYGQIAENHLNDNSIEKAVDAFQRALKALPKQVSDKFFRETVSLIPLAVAARGYLAEAIGLAKLLETRFASEPEKLGAIGEFYATFDAASDAIRTLEAASKLAPEDARLYRALGAAYRRGLRVDDAIASYQLAVRYDVNDRRAFYDLADLYRSQGAYEDALKLYRRQLEIEPKHTPSLKGIALALTALGKDDEAAAALNQARDLAGSLKEITDDQLLQTQLAFYYLAQNKVRDAQRAADYALAVEPRYSWARIIAAEILLAQGKYFEAERHLIEAQKLSSFPTLSFTLGKVYLIVEDFDGAAEQFAKAFRYSPTTQFTTRLGGSRDVQGDDLRDLLAPEHQAAIFLAEAPTSDEIFRIAASLVRVNTKLAEAEASAKADQKDGQLENAALGFVEAENSRRSFRALYMATKLAQAGRALPTAIRLADQAIDLAEVATETNGSLRDYPNYDRTGRLHVFRGRAYDARGWALFKSGRIKDSLITLSQAVVEYGNLPEGKRAFWHLAAAHEAAGAQAQALELYLAGYEPPDAKNKADIQRIVIETLYRKVNNSLDGLEAKLGQPVSPQTLTDITTTSLQATATAHTVAAPTEVAAKSSAPPVEIVAEQVKPDAQPEAKSTNLLTGISPRRQPNTAAENRPAATKPVTTPTQAVKTATPEKEPVRLGLFGIPVGGAKTTRPNNQSTAKAEPVTPKNEPLKEVAKEPAKETKETLANNLPPTEPRTKPVATPVVTEAAPMVKDPVVAKVEEKPTEVKIEPKATETKTEPLIKPVATPVVTEAAPMVKDPVVAKVEEKPTEVKIEPKATETKTAGTKLTETKITTNEQTVTVVPSEPIAPIEPPRAEIKPENKAVNNETASVELPKVMPVQLPELTNGVTGQLVITKAVLPAPPMLLALTELDEPPAPPAPQAIPKPTLSPSAVATQANTEPTITVRYDDLPAKPTSAPAGETGHAIAPPASGRPRRVAPANETPATNETPVNNSRPRRVPPPPTKP